MPDTPSGGKRYYTVDDIYNMLGGTRDISTIQRWLREGMLRGIKPGGTGAWLIPLEAWEEFLAKSSNVPPPNEEDAKAAG